MCEHNIVWVILFRRATRTLFVVCRNHDVINSHEKRPNHNNTFAWRVLEILIYYIRVYVFDDVVQTIGFNDSF